MYLCAGFLFILVQSGMIRGQFIREKNRSNSWIFGAEMEPGLWVAGLPGHGFFPRTIAEWNKLSQDVRCKSSIVSFRSALLKPPGPVENNFWAMALRQ